MKPVLLFFLAIVCVQCRQKSVKDKESELHCPKSLLGCICCGKGGNDNPVDNLMKNKEARVTVASECDTVVKNTEAPSPDGKYLQYSQNEACDVGTAKRLDKTVLVAKLAAGVSETRDFGSCGDGEAYKAFFLPQIPSNVTYMILDPARAQWFFTARLTGCDMYIATHPGRKNEPLLIHANGDATEQTAGRAENLEEKGDRADDIVNDNAPDGYVLRARVYSALETPSPDVDTYLTRYKTSHGDVEVQPYDNYRPSAHETDFFGHFSTCSSWTFYIKSVQTGKIKKINY